MDNRNNLDTVLSNQKLITTYTHNALIQVDLDSSLLTIKWDPLTETEDFKAAGLYVVELIKEYQIQRLLHDVTNLSYLIMESHNRLLRKILPQLLEAGVKRIARVAPEKPIAVLVCRKFRDEVAIEMCRNNGCEYNLFTDYNAALYWVNK